MSDFVAFKAGLTDLLPRLNRYALVLTPTRADADDLLQMTCERALGRWEQFQQGTNLRAWLFTIMSSVWKNELRARAIRSGQGFVDPESLVASQTNIAEGNIYLREVLEKVLGLPENQRELILLVYVEGLSYAEAAVILDVPPGTVMSRLSRARTALSRQVNSEPDSDRLSAI